MLFFCAHWGAANVSRPMRLPFCRVIARGGQFLRRATGQDVLLSKAARVFQQARVWIATLGQSFPRPWAMAMTYDMPPGCGF